MDELEELGLADIEMEDIGACDGDGDGDGVGVNEEVALKLLLGLIEKDGLALEVSERLGVSLDVGDTELELEDEREGLREEAAVIELDRE